VSGVAVCDFLFTLIGAPPIPNIIKENVVIIDNIHGSRLLTDGVWPQSPYYDHRCVEGCSLVRIRGHQWRSQSGWGAASAGNAQAMVTLE